MASFYEYNNFRASHFLVSPKLALCPILSLVGTPNFCSVVLYASVCNARPVCTCSANASPSTVYTTCLPGSSQKNDCSPAALCQETTECVMIFMKEKRTDVIKESELKVPSIIINQMLGKCGINLRSQNKKSTIRWLKKRKQSTCRCILAGLP